MRGALLVLLLATAPAFGQVPEDVSPLFLAASVNGVDAKTTAVFWQLDGQWVAEPRQWTDLGIKLDEKEHGQQQLSANALGIDLVIDESAMTANAIVPASRLPTQTLGAARIMPKLSAPAPGVLINYNLAGQFQDTFQGVSLGHEVRTGGRWGLLLSSGQINWDSKQGRDYVRGNTLWQKDDYQRLITYQVGDVRSGGLQGANLGGIRIAKDPGSLDPYNPVYPMPTLGGVALDPSTVQILANQAKVAEHDVGKGPFTIERFPLRNGRNAMDVVVRDAFGREQVVSSKQLYFTPQVLRKGLTTWSVAAGQVRQGTTDTYGKLGASFDIAHGVSDAWTLTGSAQTDGDNHNAIVGARTVLGPAGLLQASVGQSLGQQGSGTYRAVRYSYTGPNVGVSVAHETSDQFWQLSSNDLLSLQAKSRTEASLSFANDHQTLRGRVSYGDLETMFDDRATRIRYASAEGAWHRGRHTLSASALFDLQRHAPTLAVGYRYQMSHGSIVATARQAPDISRYTLSGSWHDQVNGKPSSLRGEISETDGRQQLRVGGDLMTSKGWARVDVQHSEQGTAASGEFSGAVHIGKGGTTWMPRVYDGYAVVEIPGVADVPVRANGRTIGKTNKAGRLVVPGLFSLAATPIRIDDKALPGDVQLETSELTAAPQRLSGAKVVFPVLTQNGRGFILKRATPIESGATAKTDLEETLVGFDGAIYLEHPKPGQAITVVDKQSSCVATLPQALPAWTEQPEIKCK